ncbi:UNKNOWN [Stylonychia lemnae]|uniref:Calponin-homology (CH) domain-containing protein n=1 Tax=Stylonychia lemnae TaxID=5949 RepID=A0A078B5B6_STYLE|nr:UNKNOWN [Stylonychia lemnae]|eukprot:CDW89619.1 UNKNOWN [Stylonychia lemnae]
MMNIASKSNANNDDLFFVQNMQMPPYEDHSSYTHQTLTSSIVYNANLGPLIDWVNSFNDPYCLLVNSLNDLRDGIAFCHLVGLITCTPSDQEKIRQLVYYDASSNGNNEDLIAQNMDLALNILKNSSIPVPDHTLTLNSQSLMENDECLLQFLEVLKQVHELLGGYTNNTGILQSPISKQQQQQQYAQNHNTSAMSYPQQKTQQLPSQIHEDLSSNGQTQLMSKSPSVGNVFQPQFTSAYQNHNPLDSDNKMNSLIITPRNLPLQMQTSLNNFNPNQVKDKFQSNLSHRRFENSLEINNISPIGQKQSVSPLNHNQEDVSHVLSMQLGGIIMPIGNSITPDNIFNKDPEEIQLEKEIEAINDSYMVVNHNFISQAKDKENLFGVKHSNSIMNAHNKSMSNNQQSLYQNHISSVSTSASREKWKIKQLQNENQDYSKIIKNSNQKMIKTVDPATAQTLQSNHNKINQSQQIQDQYNVFDKSNIQDGLTMESNIRSQKHKFVSNQTSSVSQDQQQNFMQNQSFNKHNLPLQRKEISRQQTFQNTQKPASDEDEIMNEMQTLNIQPESKELGSNKNKPLLLQEVKIDIIDIKTQYKVLDWLVQDVKLLKNNERLINELPLYCKNGVFFCDLINRLNGKHAIIKGIDRNPKNMTSIIANLNKILDYFRQFPKFCARYLWAQKYIIDGNTDVIWGFLDDIWHWHFNKISPYDITYKAPSNNLKSSQSRTRDDTSSLGRYQQQQLNQLTKENTSNNITQMLPPKIQSNRTMDRRTSQNATNANTTASHVPQNYSNDYDQHNQKINIQRVQTPNIQNMNKGNHHQNDSMVNQTLPRERSYGSLHQQKTPLIRNLRAQDAPLQAGYKSTRAVMSTHGNNSFSRNSGSKRRRDISNINSPIAKDQTGKVYFMSNSKKDDRDMLNLLSINQKGASNNYEHFTISDDMISDVRTWLFNLKFQSFLSKEFDHKDICGDPYSNGILLGELFSYLEKITLYKIIQYPSTISECKENLLKVISIIKQRRRDFPSRLLSEKAVENILKRDKQTIYSILYYLKLSYPDVQPIENEALLNTTSAAANCSVMSNQSQQNLALPYTTGEIKLLETSILNWIKSMGVLSKFGQHYNEVQSLLEIQKEISNGSLLCEIVTTIFNVKIMGIFKDPKTEATAISNIRKSLEVLKKQTKMSQKFTWAEREIYEGQINIVIGLLEDLHRCFDGLQPRKRGPNYFHDGPYLGDTLYKVQPYMRYRNQNGSNNINGTKDSSIGKELMKLNKADQCISTINQSLEFGGGLTDRHRFQEIPSLLSYRNHQTIQPSETNKTTQKVIQIENTSTSLYAGYQTLSPRSTIQTQIQTSQERKPNFGVFLSNKLNKEQTNGSLQSRGFNDIINTTMDKRENININKAAAAVDRTTFSPQSFTMANSKFDERNYNPFQQQCQPYPQKLKPSNLTLDEENYNAPTQQTNTNKYQAIPQKINELVLPQKSDITQQYPVAPTRSPLNIKSRGQSLEFEGGSHIKRPSMISIEDYENEEHNQNRNVFNQKEKQKIAQWMGQFNISIPKTFFTEKDNIPEFKDGQVRQIILPPYSLLLSQIVGVLENHKFENLQLNPKSSASCLQNIKKALQLLKKKNVIKFYFLISLLASPIVFAVQ